MCQHLIGTATMAVFGLGPLKVKSVPIPCNSWNCEECAKRKAIILGNRVKKGFEYERVRFATLTTNKSSSLTSQLKSLKVCWNRLRGALVRKFGLSKFFWVLEFGHEKGRPHLHFLFNCYIPQRSLSRLAARAGFGPIVDIREVKDGGGFGYVFKYLKKDCGSRAGATALRLAHCRRFGCSRNIKPIRNLKDHTINLEFLKDEFSSQISSESTELYSRILCKNLVSKTVKGLSSEAVGESRFSDSEFPEFAANLKSLAGDRFALIGAADGGWSEQSIKWYFNLARSRGVAVADPPY